MRDNVVLVVGPSSIGKSSILQKFADKEKGRVKSISLDDLAASEGVRLGLIKKGNSHDLLKQVGTRKLFVIGMNGLFRYIGKNGDQHIYIVDVGSGFQNHPLMANMVSLYPSICVTADPEDAFKRFIEFRGSRDLEAFMNIEFSDVRREIYSSAAATLDTTDLSVDDAAARFGAVMQELTQKDETPPAPGGMAYLNFQKFERNALDNPGDHWKDYKSRWAYYSRATDVVKSLNLTDPAKVLEMGTMGARLVSDCRTIDYEDNWGFKNKRPDIIHDARNLPWPIRDKEYDLFIALRVYQHLTPVQRECFEEAKRIAKNVLIVTPTEYNNGGGIDLERFKSWNGGRAPSICENVMGRTTYLYLWREADMA